MTNKEIPAKEGFVSFRGYQVWYRIVGDREGLGNLRTKSRNKGSDFNNLPSAVL